MQGTRRVMASLLLELPAWHSHRKTFMIAFAASSSQFVLRTPLLSLDEFVAWGHGLSAIRCLEAGEETAAFDSAYDLDKQVLRARLREAIQRPEVLEALFVASPSLVSSLDSWCREPENERAQKVERALVKYFC